MKMSSVKMFNPCTYNLNKDSRYYRKMLESIYKAYKKLSCPQGFKLFLVEKENCSVYILETGMGECYASAGCQLLISKYNVKKMYSFYLNSFHSHQVQLRFQDNESLSMLILRVP